MKKNILILLFLAIVLNGFSQKKSVVSHAIESIKKGQLSSKSINKVVNNISSSGLENIVQFANDSLIENKTSAYILISLVARATTDLNIKEKCIDVFIDGLSNSETVIAARCADIITEYSKDILTQSQIKSIYNVAVGLRVKKPEIIKYIGYIGGEESVRALNNIVKTDSLITNVEKWNLKLALAKCGETTELDYCLNKVKSIPVNDDVVYELLPDLVYTGQRKAIDYLVDILLSNEKNCNSANVEIDQKILCGYRVMEFLACVIVDFPINFDDSGELATDDYVASLKQCREWINQNRNSYIIKADSYSPAECY